MKKIIFLIFFLITACSSKNIMYEDGINENKGQIIENKGQTYLYLNNNQDYEVVIKSIFKEEEDRLVPIKLKGKPMNAKTWEGNTARGAEIINGTIVLWWANPNVNDKKLRLIQTKHNLFSGEYIGGRPVNLDVDPMIFQQILKVD